MSARAKSSRLARAVACFLKHKRALGRRYRGEAFLFRRLLAHLRRRGDDDLNADAFQGWMHDLARCHPNTRHAWHQLVRRFCLYRRRAEPNCFVPPEVRGRPRPYITPIIMEPDQIARMLDIASSLTPSPGSPLRGPINRMAVVLLYTAGLRLGELIRLRLGDVEDRGTVLRIRESKFHKSRLVPLSPSASRELRRFLRQRSRAFSSEPETPLLCTHRRSGPKAYGLPGMWEVVHRLFVLAEVRDSNGRIPRVHDLRHTFAIQALIRWYRKNQDVQSSLPKLALFMGHVSIESSAYYLRWVPTLRDLASKRFETRFGELLAGGAQ